jgi:hypothetical protein
MLLRDSQLEQKVTYAGIVSQPMQLVDVTASQPDRLRPEKYVLQRKRAIRHGVFIIVLVGGDDERRQHGNKNL